MASRGILILGPPGSGKSSLALRLIKSGAWLIADDQTILIDKAGQLQAECPPQIRGRLEVRGIGIVAAPHQRQAIVALALDLEPAARDALLDRRMPVFGPWRPPNTVASAIASGPHIPCVPFDAIRPDAVEAVIAALAQSHEWGDSSAP